MNQQDFFFFYVIKANLLLINFKMCFDESIFLQITVMDGFEAMLNFLL